MQKYFVFDTYLWERNQFDFEFMEIEIKEMNKKFLCTSLCSS